MVARDGSHVTRVAVALLCAVALGAAAVGAAAVGTAAVGSVQSIDANVFRSDPVRSALHFTFEQAGAKTRGRFEDFSVVLEESARGEPQALRVLVQVRSLNTQDKDRDGALRGAELFDVARYPTAAFESARIETGANGNHVARGRLTIRDVSRDVALPFTLVRQADGGRELRGRLSLQRLDYGVGQGEWRSTQWVGNEVLIDYTVVLRPGARDVARLTT